MAGISSNAAGGLKGKKGYSGNELQSNEFIDRSGLELYDFNARTYDQQIGRFIQIDPLTDEGDQERLSPYHYSLNNPIRFSDPDGKFPIIPVARALYQAYRLYRTGLSINKILRDFTPSPARPGTGIFERTKAPQTQTLKSSAPTTTRSTNKLQPDKNAQGDHSTFKRDDNGNIYKYQEWKKNDQNPNNFDPGKRFDGGKPDGKPGADHVNKKTGESQPTPHVNEKQDARAPEANEIPNNSRFDPLSLYKKN